MTTKNSQPNIRCGAYVRVNGACQATMSDAFRVQNDAAETFIQTYTHHGWTGTYDPSRCFRVGWFETDVRRMIGWLTFRD